MKVLVTNDDGVFAPGIVELSRALYESGFPPLIVAPDRERSSVGHSITLHRPLRIWRVEYGPYSSDIDAYACGGTPSDCVVLGLEEVDRDITLVISGINNGPNVGDDLTYSGTVSAAMEGVVMGRQAVAVSLNCGGDDLDKHFDTAARVAVRMLQWLEDNPLPSGVLLNVNVPNRPFSEIRGFRVTKKGVRIYEGKVTRLNDPHGRNYYWISGKPEDQLIEGCDVWAIANNYVSITPIHMDMTHYGLLKTLAGSDIEDLKL